MININESISFSPKTTNNDTSVGRRRDLSAEQKLDQQSKPAVANKDTQISIMTFQKVVASKAFLEDHYRGMIRGLKQTGIIDNSNNANTIATQSRSLIHPMMEELKYGAKPELKREIIKPNEPAQTTDVVVMTPQGYTYSAYGLASNQGCSPYFSSKSSDRNSDAPNIGFIYNNGKTVNINENSVNITSKKESNVISSNQNQINNPNHGQATYASVLMMGSVRPPQKMIRPSNFILLKLIGRGAFGEVFICAKKKEFPQYLAKTMNSGGIISEKLLISGKKSSSHACLNNPNPMNPQYDVSVHKNDQLYALKRMRKVDMIKKCQVNHVRSEAHILAETCRKQKTAWIVCLYYSFQDEKCLYMVTEYMPGGDMMSWLINEQIFSVDATRFYIAELCIAINSVHEMFYCHRDCKPDNILLDSQGHLKLSDFGLCKRFTLPTKKQQQAWLQKHQNFQQQGSLPADVMRGTGATNENASEQDDADSQEKGDKEEVINLYDDDDIILKLADIEFLKGSVKGELVPSDETDELGNSAAVLSNLSSSNTSVGFEGRQSCRAASNPKETLDRIMTDAIKRKQKFDSIVGSPGYIAPEILLRQRYGVNCDYWSVGVIMYEMLYGQPPFYSEDPHLTCKKIVNWEKTLCFYPPGGAPQRVPGEAINLMSHLLCNANERYEFSQIKRHPFFASIDWDNLRNTKAPFVPSLSDPLDTRYFPAIDDRKLVAAMNAYNLEQQKITNQNFLNAGPLAAGTNMFSNIGSPSLGAGRTIGMGNSEKGQECEMEQFDPRGVMFADFNFRYD